jgi:alkylated DNA repair dioxygenase AlkB
MDLFNQEIIKKNLLPKDGEVYYFEGIFNQKTTQDYFDKLFSDIPWQNDEVIIFGKHIITKRKTAFYGSLPFEYKYSNIPRVALQWTDTLETIKTKVEVITRQKYNACLLNLYHNGEESMGWHTDDESTLVRNGSIASLSLGAERKFVFKHRLQKEKIEILLESGSLLEMKGVTQNHWLHRLPPTKKIKFPRINLTFRQMK